MTPAHLILVCMVLPYMYVILYIYMHLPKPTLYHCANELTLLLESCSITTILAMPFKRGAVHPYLVSMPPIVQHHTIPPFLVDFQ